MKSICIVFWMVMLPLVAAPPGEENSSAPKEVRVPRVDIGIRVLEARRQAQLATVSQFKVYYDFKFSDRYKQSGITFVHHVTRDSNKDYKAVHYDHANGLAIADVDGDGRYDIYFLSQTGSNELWQNRGNGKFVNITAAAGVGLGDRISVTAAFADMDNDGDPDLMVTTVRMGNVFYRNEGKGRFTDMSKEWGFDYSGHSSGMAVFDYDRDGLLDCFLTNVGGYTIDRQGEEGYYIGREDAFQSHLYPERAEASILYHNEGGKLKDVSRAVGLVDLSWSGDANFVDIDGDGYLDIYLPNMQGDDHLYLNRGGEKFEENTAPYFPKTPWGAMSVMFFDYNNDGHLDQIVTDMHSDMAKVVGPKEEKLKNKARYPEKSLQGGENNIFGNAFYKNLGGGRYEEISDAIGAENYWPWGVSTGDLNADGYEDVFISSSMSFPFHYGVNSVLLNNRAEKFLDSEFILGVEPRRDGRTHVPWALMDCAGADKGHSFCRGKRGLYQTMGTIGTRTSALFDLDDDGDLDIVTLEFGAEPQILISDLSAKKKVYFLKLELVGTTSNRDGLGAIVRVKTGSRTVTQINDGKSGYLTQSSLPLYFGLGDAEKVDRIEILWPSGTKQSVDKGIRINSLMVIEEPKKP